MGAESWMQKGVHWIPDYPPGELDEVQERQVRAMEDNKVNLRGEPGGRYGAVRWTAGVPGLRDD